jgi:hypothetical protein
MADKLDFNSITFKNSQAKKLLKNKKKPKKKGKNPTGIAGLNYLNPKKGKFGYYS